MNAGRLDKNGQIGPAPHRQREIHTVDWPWTAVEKKLPLKVGLAIEGICSDPIDSLLGSGFEALDPLQLVGFPLPCPWGP